jgi:hypothetical protein
VSITYLISGRPIVDGITGSPRGGSTAESTGNAGRGPQRNKGYKEAGAPTARLFSARCSDPGRAMGVFSPQKGPVASQVGGGTREA